MKAINLECGVKLAAAALGGFLLSGCVYDAGPPVAYSTHTVETHRPGYVVRTLPAHQVEVIGGTRYYRQGEVYYTNHPGGYVVVDPPRTRTVIRQGTVVRSLPRGYRTVIRQGTPYYIHDDVYYERSGSGYRVIPAF
jgi:hypothetical protein